MKVADILFHGRYAAHGVNGIALALQAMTLPQDGAKVVQGSPGGTAMVKAAGIGAEHENLVASQAGDVLGGDALEVDIVRCLGLPDEFLLKNLLLLLPLLHEVLHVVSEVLHLLLREYLALEDVSLHLLPHRGFGLVLCHFLGIYGEGKCLAHLLAVDGLKLNDVDFHFHKAVCFILGELNIIMNVWGQGSACMFQNSILKPLRLSSSYLPALKLNSFASLLGVGQTVSSSSLRISRCSIFLAKLRRSKVMPRMAS